MLSAAFAARELALDQSAAGAHWEFLSFRPGTACRCRVSVRTIVLRQAYCPVIQVA